MKELVFDSTLSVEIDEIDDDHRRLVDLYNILNRAVIDKEKPEYIEIVLQELISCTNWHFKHEERLMFKYGYPEFSEHKENHEMLIESSQQLMKKFSSNDRQLSNEDIEYLEIWLTEHILTSDMRLGNFLNSVM